MTELLVGSATSRISVIADPTKSRYPLDWARATRREDSEWAPNGGLDNETTLGRNRGGATITVERATPPARSGS